MKTRDRCDKCIFDPRVCLDTIEDCLRGKCHFQIRTNYKFENVSDFKKCMFDIFGVSVQGQFVETAIEKGYIDKTDNQDMVEEAEKMLINILRKPYGMTDMVKGISNLIDVKIKAMKEWGTPKVRPEASHSSCGKLTPKPKPAVPSCV